jgi:hypothetical protein
MPFSSVGRPAADSARLKASRLRRIATGVVIASAALFSGPRDKLRAVGVYFQLVYFA